MGLKYILAAFLPLTVFLIHVFILRIRASSPRLKMFIIISQTVTSPIFVRVMVATCTYSSDPIHKQLYVHVHTLVAMFGIGISIFFRTLLPPICLNVSTWEAIAMDYSVAFSLLQVAGLRRLHWGCVLGCCHDCECVLWVCVCVCGVCVVCVLQVCVMCVCVHASIFFTVFCLLLSLIWSFYCTRSNYPNSQKQLWYHRVSRLYM